MSDPVRDTSRTLIDRYASRLKFPQLFWLTAILFVIDLIIPDLFPFVDEVLLGLATLLLANWKKKVEPADSPDRKPPTKDITPPEA